MANRVLAGIAEELLAEFPENAGALGLDKDGRAGLKARLTDRSLAGQRRQGAAAAARLARLKAIEDEKKAAAAEEKRKRDAEGGLKGDNRPLAERMATPVPVIGDGGASWRQKVCLTSPPFSLPLPLQPYTVLSLSPSSTIELTE